MTTLRTWSTQPPRQPRNPGSGPWWIHPASLLLLVSLPTLLAALVTAEWTYESKWRTAKHLTAADGGFALLIIMAIALGAWIAAARRGAPEQRQEPLPDPLRQSLERMAGAFYWLAIVGYAAWIVVGMLRGVGLGLVGEALSSGGAEAFALKRLLEPIGGITTLAQFGVPASMLYVLTSTRAIGHKQLAMRRVCIIAGLAGVRMVVFSERLALLEIIIPVGILVLYRTWERGQRRQVIALAPLLTVPLLLVGFALTEATRSWSHYSTSTDETVVEFTLARVGGYYATAYNNGALLKDRLEGTGEFGYFSSEFARRFPVVGPATARLTGLGHDVPQRIANAYADEANPEFSNYNGFFALISDFGPAGGVLVGLLGGFACGRMYLSFGRQRCTGLVGYPVLVVAILEMPRFLYVTSGRVFPILVGIGCTFLVERRYRS